MLLSSAVHVLVALAVVLAGFGGMFHPIYWAGAAVFVPLLVYQHRLVKPDDISKVNLAFGTTNGVAALVFCSVAVASIILFW